MRLVTFCSRRYVVVELEVDGIGVLRNTVVEKYAAPREGAGVRSILAPPS